VAPRLTNFSWALWLLEEQRYPSPGMFGERVEHRISAINHDWTCFTTVMAMAISYNWLFQWDKKHVLNGVFLVLITGISGHNCIFQSFTDLRNKLCYADGVTYILAFESLRHFLHLIHFCEHCHVARQIRVNSYRPQAKCWLGRTLVLNILNLIPGLGFIVTAIDVSIRCVLLSCLYM